MKVDAVLLMEHRQDVHMLDPSWGLQSG